MADAEVVEAASAVLTFGVTLTRAASQSLTIDYTTSDDTASAGSDYTATSGTLTISAGNSSGTIEVPVLDDSHDDAGETLTPTLSNPSSGTITDGSATGTITNDDALPAALLARLGRTAALHVVEQIEERVNAPREPGFEGRVAGRQTNRDMGREFALDFVQQMTGGRMSAAGGPGGATGRFGNRGPGAGPGPETAMGDTHGMPAMQGLHPQDAYQDGIGLGLGTGPLTEGSSFALNRATSGGGVLSFWSRSASSGFQGRDGLLALGGDVRSNMFGTNYAKGRMVTGVSPSHTRGIGSYDGADSGRMTSRVTGLYPWIGFKANERVTVWTVAGYGAGGLMLTPGAGAPIETGLSMAMAAGGGRGELFQSSEGLTLAFKADALWVGTRSQAASGPGGKLDSTRASVNRLRTAIDGSQSLTVANRMALTPSIEIGIRQDGGDAETGRGMDVAAGLVLAGQRDGTGRRHPGAQATRAPGRRVRRERHVDLGELQPDAVDAARVLRTGLARLGRGRPQRSRSTVGPGDGLHRPGPAARRRREPPGDRARRRPPAGTAVRGHATHRRADVRVRTRVPGRLQRDGARAGHGEPGARHRRGAARDASVPAPARRSVPERTSACWAAPASAGRPAQADGRAKGQSPEAAHREARGGPQPERWSPDGQPRLNQRRALAAV